MPLMGTNMPTYTFPSMFQTSDTELLSPRIIHPTKSPKRHHICKLCLYTLEEHKCLILTFYHVLKLKYSTQADK